jgi:hypothetical protein
VHPPHFYFLGLIRLMLSRDISSHLLIVGASMISRETGRTPDCHFEKSRLSQVDVCPGDAVVEAGLSSAGEHFPSIGFC